ncbi:golvesin C-terminal-like domain-containing protein [Corallococcus llansteffanensis]|uniref:Golvesin/Xly CBD-like domain-containing protein n=1 Tax=Corallococcus llansteffanensis TaxID=2316731 RepID=A0A3A8Q571_9BACT|nr:hypothetical protein [Corallococcus llansteffanensis]RKH63843.1 hypothetical protein D7V93_08210 [Corallococcus llansteffanensis]
MRASWRSTVMTVMLGAVFAQGVAAAEPAPPAAETLRVEAGAQRWTEDLSVGEGTGELVRTRDGLLYEPNGVMRRPEGLNRLTGLYTFPARTLSEPVDTFRPRLQATQALGTGVEVDVRVRVPGGAWSEWRTATAGEAVRLPRAGTEVQVRLALVADERGRGPVVQELALEGWREGSDTEQGLQPLAALTYRVYATREGLVGGTTANGHVIKSNDRFVALPSRRGLASNGGSEYQVRVCYAKTAKCTTTSVWDVGPWNTKDDYWNPSSVREMWKTLPQGKPEAQAAYQDGFNGGLDQFGRRPANPAGIDLADGTFWTDLGMSNNDWVDVTYLWTSGGGTPTGLVIDSNNANNDQTKGYIQLTGSSWASSTNVAGYYGSSYLVSPGAAVSEPATFYFYLAAAGTKTVDAWWTAATDRSTAAPFIVTSATGTQLANVKVNQTVNGARWNTLGTWSFPAGWNKVQLSRWVTAGTYVVADAIQVR